MAVDGEGFNKETDIYSYFPSSLKLITDDSLNVFFGTIIRPCLLLLLSDIFKFSYRWGFGVLGFWCFSASLRSGDVFMKYSGME